MTQSANTLEGLTIQSALAQAGMQKLHDFATRNGYSARYLTGSIASTHNAAAKELSIATLGVLQTRVLAGSNAKAIAGHFAHELGHSLISTAYFGPELRNLSFSNAAALPRLSQRDSNAAKVNNLKVVEGLAWLSLGLLSREIGGGVPIYTFSGRDVTAQVMQIVNAYSPQLWRTPSSVMLESIYSLYVNANGGQARLESFVAPLSGAQLVGRFSPIGTVDENGVGAPFQVPFSVPGEGGSMVNLGSAEINEWLAALLMENGIDPNKIKINILTEETEIGRSRHLIFEEIQQGSTRNDFTRFDPWLRNNAWDSIHSYWEQTSIDNRIRNNPDLQNELAPGMDAQWTAPVAVDLPIADGPAFQPLTEGDAVTRQAHLLIQAMSQCDTGPVGPAWPSEQRPPRGPDLLTRPFSALH